jgi:hypothetical protein
MMNEDNWWLVRGQQNRWSDSEIEEDGAVAE